MYTKFLFIVFPLVVFTHVNFGRSIASPEERICGKWETSENNLIIQVYREDNNFKAKVVWFNDGDPKLMNTWTDRRNPDKSLRSRKIIGLSVLRDLTYDPHTNTWENGMIYDSKHGRDWNASAYIGKSGLLEVKGYWHFKFIGRTLTFKRV
jgi:uncharacterized protein (DUF2147 family)